MKRMLTISTAVTLLSAALAWGETEGVRGNASGQATGEAKTGALEAQGQAAGATSVEAADSKVVLEDIASKGSKASAKVCDRAERRLEKIAKKIDDAASAAEGEVAGRLAAELDTRADLLVHERAELGTGWGELVIAHTLKANTRTHVTVAQLFVLRQGMGWGRIAAGLGLEPDEVVSASDAEARVARGEARADGKVAVVHGPGARAGVAVRTDTRAAAPAGAVGAGAAAGAGVSIPKIRVGN